MGDLVNAVSEFLAAIFARFGFVGRQRRRVNIKEDLALLDALRESPAFGPQSAAASHLSAHIDNEVASYSGVEPKRKIEWGSVVTAFVCGIPAAYVTYRLNQGGFSWFSLIPGLIAAFMLIGGLGLLFNSGDSESQEDEGEGPASPRPSSEGMSK
jgi:hypothetical protein